MNRPEMTQPQTDVAGVLRHLALDERVKRHVLATPELYQPLLCAASRYIGGESLNACLEVARQTNQLGHAVTIDFMGESTRDRVEAATATAEFIRVAEANIADVDETLKEYLNRFGPGMISYFEVPENFHASVSHLDRKVDHKTIAFAKGSDGKHARHAMLLLGWRTSELGTVYLIQNSWENHIIVEVSVELLAVCSAKFSFVKDPVTSIPSNFEPYVSAVAVSYDGSRPSIAYCPTRF